jgi:2-keto-4-pentenoate hydratase
MSVQQLDACAQYLLECRRSGPRPNGLSVEFAPRDLEDAYRIQSIVAEHRGATAGFKVGITSVEAQRATGASEPIVGRLALHDILRNTKRVALSEHHLSIVEAEVVFEIGEDMSPLDAPFSQEQIAGKVSGAFAGIEICNSRFSDVDAASLAHIVADNSNADLLVIGQRLTNADMQSLATLPVTLVGAGAATIAGSTARVLGHPLASLTWLANWLAARGEGLKRGQLVASGSCTGMTKVAVGNEVVATFGVDTRVAIAFDAEIRVDEVQR